MADKVTKRISIYNNGVWQTTVDFGADAANVSITDSGDSFTATTVEAALAELKSDDSTIKDNITSAASVASTAKETADAANTSATAVANNLSSHTSGVVVDNSDGVHDLKVIPSTNGAILYYKDSDGKWDALINTSAKIDIATVDAAGIVKPDGTSITITTDGTGKISVPHIDLSSITTSSSYAGIHNLRVLKTIEDSDIIYVLQAYDTTDSSWHDISRNDGTTLVQRPTLSSTTLSWTYDGSAHGPSYNTFDDVQSKHIQITNATATNAGTYTLTFHLSGTNDLWADTLTNEDITQTYTINVATVTTPSVTIGTYTYIGSTQGPTISYDTTKATISGTSSAFLAGSYSFTIALNDTTNYQWSSGSSADITYDWSIGKADGSATLSATSVTLNSDSASATVTVSNATGSVSVLSSDTSLATVGYSDGTITITSPNSTGGSATIIVTIAASSNYNSKDYIISVTCDFLKIVTWAAGTDEQIADMVEAADAGTINLADYWAVGDERTVSLSAMEKGNVGETQDAQSVVWVLIANCANANSAGNKINANDSNSYQLVTATSSGRMIPSFIIGQKNLLATLGYMNPTNTNSGSWNGCARRSWCNNQYYNAIPSTLKSILKQVKVATISEYNSSTMQYSNDYIFLNATKEIFGGTGGGNSQASNTTESSHLVQLSYYETSSHRIKYQGSTSNAYQWWNRSPGYYYSSYFCSVSSVGSADYTYASITNGLAPCGCV